MIDTCSSPKEQNRASWKFGAEMPISVAIWVLSVVFFLLCAKCVESTMEFPPLPKGEPYSLQGDEDKWSLQGLTSIANGIALTLRSQPPYGT